MPVLTGSLIRVPLGIWTDKYGGRIVMAVLMALTVPAIWLMAYATAYWHFLVIGLFVGLARRLVLGRRRMARWFPPEPPGASRWASTAPATRAPRSTSSSRRRWSWLRLDHGAAGLRGHHAGHGGAVLDVQPGDPAHLVPSNVKFTDQLQGAEGSRGAGSSASTTASCSAATSRCRLWMVQYYVGEYGLDIRAAALLARASRCPAACCARSAAGCRTSTARTASPGG